MAITINNEYLAKEEFSDESELQGHLEQCPYLLVSDSAPKVASVQREVHLPSAGILDLLLVDESGCPIAVEVKLARNGQSRREVVAQAFDYVSDLSQVTVDELDSYVDGALEQVLSDFSSTSNLWKICGTNLRAGIIKVVIAVDNANEDLIRIVRYINDHSDLNVSLVEISKYKNGEILVPSLIVEGNQSLISGKPENPSIERNEIFEKVVRLYNMPASEELKTRNKAKTYRQIRFNTWPSSVHYEFNDYRSSNQIGVELHLESDDVAFLGETIKQYAGKNIVGSTLEWDDKWSKKRGRIALKYSPDTDALSIANAMNELIKLTQKSVSEKLTKPTEAIVNISLD
jgi:hypothetical protein